MDTARYFVLPGRYNSGYLVLIKFDSDRNYWYWDRNDQTWIPGTTIFEDHWLDGHLTRIVEEEGKRMIEEEAKNRFLHSKIPYENATRYQDSGMEHGIRTAVSNTLRKDSL